MRYIFIIIFTCCLASCFVNINDAYESAGIHYWFTNIIIDYNPNHTNSTFGTLECLVWYEIYYTEMEDITYPDLNMKYNFYLIKSNYTIPILLVSYYSTGDYSHPAIGYTNMSGKIIGINITELTNTIEHGNYYKLVFQLDVYYYINLFKRYECESDYKYYY